MKIATVFGQVYILPYIKITYTRILNGDLELIIGWLNKEIIFSPSGRGIDDRTLKHKL